MNKTSTRTNMKQCTTCYLCSRSEKTKKKAGKLHGLSFLGSLFFFLSRSETTLLLISCNFLCLERVTIVVRSWFRAYKWNIQPEMMFKPRFGLLEMLFHKSDYGFGRFVLDLTCWKKAHFVHCVLHFCEVIWCLIWKIGKKKKIRVCGWGLCGCQSLGFEQCNKYP